MLAGMPPTQRHADQDSGSGRRRVCTATTSQGQPCRRTAVAGLTVCKSHGGGTAASVRAGKRAAVSQQAATLWGISSDAGGISIEEQLNQLARNKVTDILALRLELSREGGKHIGLLLDSKEVTETEVEDDIFQTVKKKHASGVSPWVVELHKAEQELLAILRLLHEITGGTEEVDTKRLRMQTARETARLLKAFPGLSVDDVAAEVSKRAS
jgi:hypothetical protein